MPEVDEDDDEGSYIRAFKEMLKQSVLQRFDTHHGDALKAIGRKIVTTDIFNDPFYILATILDPRSKTVPFEGKNYSVKTSALVTCPKISESF